MDQTKRLYLNDKFDRKKTSVCNASAALVKVCSAVRLDNKLHNTKLDNHEKVRQYVAELFKHHHTTATSAGRETHRHIVKACHSIVAIHLNVKTDTTASAAAAAASTADSSSCFHQPTLITRSSWTTTRMASSKIPSSNNTQRHHLHTTCREEN